MAPSSMAGLKSMTKGLNDKKAVFYFIALLYPVTISSSLYYCFKGPSNKFHTKRNKINIMEKSQDIQDKRRHVIKEVLNAYNCRPNRNTEHVYDKNATFEDPLIYMKGIGSITAMIWGLPILAREFKVI